MTLQHHQEEITLAFQFGMKLLYYIHNHFPPTLISNYTEDTYQSGRLSPLIKW